MRTFTLIFGGSSIALPAGETLIGRGQACRIRFADLRVSRNHLRISVSDLHALVEDLGSANGTRLNGKALTLLSQLADGDDLVLGGCTRISVVVEEGVSRMARQTAESMDTLVHYAPVLDHIRTSDLTLRSTSTGNSRNHRRSTERESRDRRKHARTNADAAVFYDSDTLRIDGLAQNLSDGGVFIITELLDQVGTSCEMTIQIEGRQRPMHARGVVRHVVLFDDPDLFNWAGMGIEFIDLRAG